MSQILTPAARGRAHAAGVRIWAVRGSPEVKLRRRPHANGLRAHATRDVYTQPGQRAGEVGYSLPLPLTGSLSQS